MRAVCRLVKETDMKRMWTGLAVLALVAMMTGCINTMEYGDATSTKPISTEFGSADLQRIAAKMVDSLLGDDLLMDDIGTAGPPLLIVDKVKNKTSQHIDTESVTDSIRTKLIRSRMFSFQDRTTEAALAEELAYQQTAAQDAVAMGQQDAPRYMLTANLSEISQNAGRVRDVYYKFTMNLRDLKSGRLLWADEEEIRKVKTRAIIGG